MTLISNEIFWLGFFSLLILTLGLRKELRKYAPLIITVSLSVGSSDVVSYRLLKPFFARERPCYVEKDVRLLAAGCGSKYGFPSNHSANAMAFATAFVFFEKKIFAWPFYVGLYSVVFLVGLSRIYLGVHYPFDVAAGWLVGMVSALFTTKILYYILPRRQEG